MLVELTEEQKMIRDTARDFAQKELAPVAAKMDAEMTLPESVIRKLGDIGFMGMLVPEQYGGSGVGTLCLALALEQIAQGCAATACMMSVHNSLTCGATVRFASEHLKSKYLPRLAGGEWLGAYGLTEPNAGSDAASLELSARKTGDKYVLNGTKAMITNGGTAQLIVVFARTNPDKSLRAKGISAFLVESAFPGFRPGKPQHKMGLKASNLTELIFEDCEVPAENMLGREGEGFVVAMDLLDGGRTGIAAQCLGIAQASLDASVKYAKERRQFDQAIAEFQAIQWKIAWMATELDAARLLTYRAAVLRDKGGPHTTEASMAKLFASAMCNMAAKEAVQIHGGAGYTKDFPVERYFRDAKATEIYEGTSEVQKMVIARGLLRD
jgi:alkylation response protein AidB-like acyl-CoA dehydrogenase